MLKVANHKYLQSTLKEDEYPYSLKQEDMTTRPEYVQKEVRGDFIRVPLRKNLVIWSFEKEEDRDFVLGEYGGKPCESQSLL